MAAGEPELNHDARRTASSAGSRASRKWRKFEVTDSRQRSASAVSTVLAKTRAVFLLVADGRSLTADSSSKRPQPMASELTWLGHGSWSIKSRGRAIRLTRSSTIRRFRR